MPLDENENNKAILILSNELRESRLLTERIDGKIDRIRDGQKTEAIKVNALLNVVTGSESGAKTGLIVRVHDLEQNQVRTDKRIDDILSMGGKIDNMESMLTDSINMQKKHPSLLYLLRFETKKTIAWIFFAIMIVSIWFVSGIRQPVLEFFGLPIF
jgi:hypothetical protein